VLTGIFTSGSILILSMIKNNLKILFLFFFGIAVVFVAISQWSTYTSKAHGQTAPSLVIYDDSLHAGFVNWSWNSNVYTDSTTSVHSGSKAIMFYLTSAWGGLYLHTDAGIDSTPYSTLTFALKAANNSQKYAVIVYDSNNQPTHDPIMLDNYGGQPTTDWKVYTIPLSDLNATNKTIKGFGLNDKTGTAQPGLAIDDISLIGTAAVQPANTPVPSPKPTTAVLRTPTTAPKSAPVVSTGNPLAGAVLFNDQDSNPAAKQVQDWQSSRPADAQTMKKIADQPKASWLGNWTTNIQSDTQNKVTKAAAINTVPVFIAYNIPGRDCGNYSAGGAGNAQAYKDWINGMAAGIGTKRAVVVIEPDALAQDCLQGAQLQERYDLLKYAVQKLKTNTQTAVYLDAGHSNWVAANTMADRLKNAGIQNADGFAVNVSNFQTNTDSINYGQQISSQVGGKHFIVDTARNGNGPTSDNAWCNPSGRALGAKPTTATGNAIVDAFLWLKYPGESDGSCNGGPAAGQWYPDYALGLAQRASW
jgi:endoglucanase